MSGDSRSSATATGRRRATISGRHVSRTELGGVVGTCGGKKFFFLARKFFFRRENFFFTRENFFFVGEKFFFLSRARAEIFFGRPGTSSGIRVVGGRQSADIRGGPGPPGPPPGPPGPPGGPRGGSRCTFFWVFNNSPSRDSRNPPDGFSGVPPWGGIRGVYRGGIWGGLSGACLGAENRGCRCVSRGYPGGPGGVSGGVPGGGAEISRAGPPRAPRAPRAGRARRAGKFREFRGVRGVSGVWESITHPHLREKFPMLRFFREKKNFFARKKNFSGEKKIFSARKKIFGDKKNFFGRKKNFFSSPLEKNFFFPARNALRASTP